MSLLHSGRYATVAYTLLSLIGAGRGICLALAGRMRTRQVVGREVVVNRFDHYSSDARRSLAQAREVALRLNHKAIRTEHLLYGMLDAADPTLNGILAALGVNALRLRHALDFVISKNIRPLLVEPSLSTAARYVLDFAEQEAKSEDAPEIGTDHLLIGLLHENNGIAAGVLESFGATLDAVRAQLRLSRSPDRVS